MNKYQEDLLVRIKARVAARCEEQGLEAGGLLRYIEYGIQPGSFLTAVLEDTLVRAAVCADDRNQRLLLDWATVMYNDVPQDARGSRENVTQWMEHNGFRGLIENGNE
jgi:hypothetical protein